MSKKWAVFEWNGPMAKEGRPFLPPLPPGEGGDEGPSDGTNYPQTLTLTLSQRERVPEVLY